MTTRPTSAWHSMILLNEARSERVGAKIMTQSFDGESPTTSIHSHLREWRARHLGSVTVDAPTQFNREWDH